MSEIIKYLESKNLTYSKVISLCKENKLWEKTEGSLVFEKKNFYYNIISCNTGDIIKIFNKEIDLIIFDRNNKKYEKKILCDYDINKYLEELKINKKDVIINNDNSLKLEESIDLLYLYVKDNKILLYELKLEIPKIKKKLLNSLMMII